MPKINPYPIVTPSDQAPSYWQRDALWSVLLPGQATLGQFTLLEQLMPQGNGPPPHVHERMAEGFYIIDGEIDYLVEHDTIHAQTGTAVWIPAGTIHGFTVTSKTARVLNFYTPGGFDDHLPYVAAPATKRTLPPDGFNDAHDPQAEAAYRDRIRDLHQETPVGDPIP
jgi:quercetin dioxygenase-like cupin family protein